jgi:hypothetical protein
MTSVHSSHATLRYRPDESVLVPVERHETFPLLNRSDWIQWNPLIKKTSGQVKFPNPALVLGNSLYYYFRMVFEVDARAL